MAKITTGNTDILKEYYDKRLGPDDATSTLYDLIRDHWNSGSFEVTGSGSRAEITYDSGAVVTVSGSGLDDESPENWTINTLRYKAGASEDGFELNGDIALDDESKIAAGTSVSEAVVFDGQGGSSLLKGGAASARIVGDISIKSSTATWIDHPKYIETLYTEKSASWSDGFTISIFGETSEKRFIEGEGEKEQTLETIVLERDGAEIFRLEEYGFIYSEITDEVIQAGPDAFIDFFLSGDDEITGTEEKDNIYAGAGDDRVDAGAGDDEMVAGSGLGNDAYEGDAGVDTILYPSATSGIRVDLGQGVASSIARDEASIGADRLSGIENVVGGDYDDILTGNASANRFDGGAGSDDITGGGGVDTAYYSGDSGEYAVKASETSLHVESTDAAANWRDTLTGIERIEFGDVTKGFDQQDHPAMASRLYQAAFDRTPDAPGLGYWVDRLDEGTSLLRAAAEFIGSPEFAMRYGASPSDEEYVNALYANVLDRAPDSAGQSFWLQELEAGLDRTKILTNFSESDENVEKTSELIAAGVEYMPWEEASLG
jgi:Ca2+-binding RTX toxin-like protein